MKTILMLIAHDFEDSEVRRPLERLFEEGYNVTLAGPQARRLYFGLHSAETMLSNVALADVNGADYDMLMIPGGPCASMLRVQDHVVELVQEFYQAGKPITAISHGLMLLASAGVLKGRAVAASGKLAADVRECGGCPVDAPLVHDAHLTTARSVEDLDPYVDAVLMRAGGPHYRYA